MYTYTYIISVVHMCICTHMYIYTYIHKHTHKRIHVHTETYTHCKRMMRYIAMIIIIPLFFLFIIPYLQCSFMPSASPLSLFQENRSFLMPRIFEAGPSLPLQALFSFPLQDLRALCFLSLKIGAPFNHEAPYL